VRLKLLTYNIHKGIGGVDRRYRPERISAVLGHYTPDLVLLQEVDDGARRSQRHRQHELFGQALNMPHRAFFPNVRVRGGGAYGNAVLSRFPIAAARNIDLTYPGRKHRSAVYAALDVPGSHGGHSRVVHVFNLHLGLAGFERLWQLSRFFADHPFAGLAQRTPVVVGGDFNDVYGGLGELLAPSGFRGIDRRPLTFPAWGPMRALDAIFVRGNLDFLRLARCDSTLARRASDHRPLIAEVRIRPHRHPHHHASHEPKPPAPRP
jgi:endonuclease/exonuclease/phosphatase family metal-dependent hydrolase